MASKKQTPSSEVRKALTHDDFKKMLEVLQTANAVELTITELKIKRAGLIHELGELNCYLESQEKSLQAHRKTYTDLVSQL